MKQIRKFKGIVIHHSLTKDSETKSWDAIRKFHVEEQKWDDIGYHMGLELIGREMRILTGRGFEYSGAHTKGKNDYLGICCVGNYDQEEPPREMVDTLVRMLAGLLVMFNMKPRDIFYHSEFSSKSCPGDKFIRLDELRRRVERYR